MGAGTASRTAVADTARSRESSIVTIFRDGDGRVTGAVGLSAAREIRVIRASRGPPMTRLRHVQVSGDERLPALAEITGALQPGLRRDDQAAAREERQHVDLLRRRAHRGPSPAGF